MEVKNNIKEINKKVEKKHTAKNAVCLILYTVPKFIKLLI